MTPTTRKHPALPAEPGWFLHKAPDMKAKPWRTGYTGKEHPHCYYSAETDIQAIAWLKDKVAEYSRPRHEDVVQRFLCSNWRTA